MSEGLLAAQRGKMARPCPRVTVDDRHVGIGRPRPQGLYEGAEGAGPVAMAACQGHLLRAWANPAGELRLCRTPAGSAAGWGEWQLLATGVDGTAQLALAANGALAYLLYVSGDGRTLLCRLSQDGGQTWGAAETAATAEAGCRLVAVSAACGAAHECIAILVDDGGTQEPDDMVQVAWRRQGAWQQAAWPRDAGDGVGGAAAVSTNGDESYSSLHFVLCGAFEDTTRPSVRLYHLQLTAEGQRLWSYRGPVLLGEAPDFSWAWPALVAPPGERPRLFLQESRGEPPTSRLGLVTLLRLGLTGPVAAGDLLPLAGEAPEGVGAAACGQELYWGSAGQVWRSPLYSGGAGQRQDVSMEVMSYTARTLARGAGSLEMALDNSRGGYCEGNRALRLGGQVCLREGYCTSEGVETVLQAPYWVERIERLYAAGRPTLTLLHCYDGWGKLWRSPADRAYEWRCSPALLLCEALERFGFVYSDDGSTPLYCDGMPPRFALAAGQPWGALVARLLDYTGCELRFFVNALEEESWPSARAHIFTPGEAPCYGYGEGGQPFQEAALSVAEPAATWAQVFGDEVYGEALDLAAMAEMGYPGVRQTVDARINEGTDVSAAAAAGYALRRYGWAEAGSWLLARPNVGLEPLDVVSVQLGGLELRRRVLGIERQYDRGGGLYRQRLLLG